MQWKQKWSLLIGTLLTSLVPISAQDYEKGDVNTDLEIGIVIPSAEIETPFLLSAKTNFWIHPNFSLFAGGELKYGEYFNMQRIDDHTVYSLDNKMAVLNATLGAKYSHRRISEDWFMDIFSNFIAGHGFAFEGSFHFSPIPYNRITLNRNFTDVTHQHQQTKTNKTVFTHFNPSFEAKITYFFDLDIFPKSEPRLLFSFAASNFNMLNAYYHATVDGIQLRDYFDLRIHQPTYTLSMGVVL